MAEYIERKAALAVMEELFHKTYPNGEEQVGFLKCHRIVRTLPAADVAPVVHSEWINHSGGNATCRLCGVRQRAVYDDYNDQNFCGHCGAKMDGGDKGER